MNKKLSHTSFLKAAGDARKAASAAKLIYVNDQNPGILRHVKGKTLPRLRKRLKKDITAKSLSREKVLATVIDLMDKTYIRRK